MIGISKVFFPMLFLTVILSPAPVLSDDQSSLIEVTPGVLEYATGTVKPLIDSHPKRDKLSLLLKVADILIDPKTGIHTNSMEPGDFIIYDKLNTFRIGFLITLKLSPEQKRILKTWHSKYMRKNPADVFFAPSADEIIKTKAAFGCSHYARAFIAVVQAEEPMKLQFWTVMADLLTK